METPLDKILQIVIFKCFLSFLGGLALGERDVLPPVGHLPAVGALQLQVVPGHR